MPKSESQELMSDNKEEVQDIINQLECLQLQQDSLQQQQDRLIARLQEATTPTRGSGEGATGVASRNRSSGPGFSNQGSTTSSFSIGDQVRIRNPRHLQSTAGTVTKISQHRITVTSQSGVTTIRAAKNLELLE